MVNLKSDNESVLFADAQQQSWIFTLEEFEVDANAPLKTQYHVLWKTFLSKNHLTEFESFLDYAEQNSTPEMVSILQKGYRYVGQRFGARERLACIFYYAFDVMNDYIDKVAREKGPKGEN